MNDFIETFYQRHSRKLFVLLLLTLPVLNYVASTIPTNNDIETWLPSESVLKQQYDQFRDDFGSEEMILLGLKNGATDPAIISSLASRIERHPEFNHCWTSQRLRDVMSDLYVSEESIQSRIIGVTESAHGELKAILLQLSPQGTADRKLAVKAIQDELSYCQIRDDQVILAGGPVVVAELDRLGSSSENEKFFLLTLLIGFGLLVVILRDWRSSASLILLTMWSIQMTVSSVKWCGGEMNFILGALPVMVMVFTLAVSIHYLHYYDSFRSSEKPISSSFFAALKPCVFASCTTTIGLASLCLSDIMPVRQFGYAASVGCIVSLFSGLLITPAIVTLCKFKGFQETDLVRFQRKALSHVIEYRKLATITALSLVTITALGLPNLSSRLDPLEFLPSSNKVITDLNEVQQKLTTIDSVEIVVDFDDDDSAFLDRVEQVQIIEGIILAHPLVRHTTSAASFFPETDQLPQSPREIGKMLRVAQAQASSSEYLACGQRLWRISARIEPEARDANSPLVADLEEKLAGYNVIITGICPLINQAQQQIFNGFWTSFGTAFLIITAVMIIAMRSVSTGLIAMIPNLTPLMIVFGILGWWDIPLDIGMMMTGSIALGIAVDGTFHFLVKYENNYRESGDSVSASAKALDKTGPPIAEAAIIAAVGMLALSCSEFGPTARFGILMSALLVAALIGDLVLLPALLALRPKAVEKEPESASQPVPQHATIKHPHFIKYRPLPNSERYRKKIDSI